MKVLFVNDNFKTGGVETFMLRLAQNLDQQEIKPIFLSQSFIFDEEIINRLNTVAHVYFWDDYLYFPNVVLRKIPPIVKVLLPIKKKKLYKDLLTDLTHVHATNVNSLIYSNRILRFLKKENVGFSVGVYHINEYNILRYKENFFLRKLSKMLKSFSSKNFIFFNEISREYYAKIFGKNLLQSPLAPIGIVVQERSQNLGIKCNRIVSIGRLTSWKTYNFHMIHVIDCLKKKGITIHYDSYGDGDQRNNLEKRVKELGLESQINFHPAIPYKSFYEVLANSLMFIGAGTAIIEASSAGIPSLVGIENLNKSEPKTYGFLHELSSYSYQELELDFKKKDIQLYIENLLETTDSEYAVLCEMAKNRAKDFDIAKTSSIFHSVVANGISIKFTFSYWEIMLMVLNMITYKFYHRNQNNQFFKRL